MALVATVAALWAPSPVAAYTERAVVYPHGQSHKTLVERITCSNRRVLLCIENAARRWHQSYSFMKALALCESHLYPWAHNPSGASGLFQFIPSTFAGTPYGRHSIWSAKWNALAAGWMLAAGRRGEWVC